MTESIFETYAPAYWAAGLPVIPLRQRNKMPELNGWSTFGTRMPDQLEMNHWIASFPTGNIGLPLGSASGIAVIDVDTEDEILIAAIREICGPSPWVRVGKKGMALAYQFAGQRNFKLRGSDGDMICEFLGQGNQVCLPGSIHPDTGRPYTSNSNLWEVKDELTCLGEDIEDKLRALLGAKGFEIGGGGRSSPLDVIPSGARDVMMVRHAGYLARVVLGIDRSATFSLFDAIQQMYHWVEAFTAKVSGDAMDPQKGVEKLIEFLIKDLERDRTMPRGWDAGLPQEWRDHSLIKKMGELNDDRRWTVERARLWWDEKTLSASDDALADALDEIILLLARDTNFTRTHQVLFFKYLKDRNGKSVDLTVREMTANLTQARKGLKSNQAENQDEIARELLEGMQRAGEIRHDLGQFWQWNGACFVALDDDDIHVHVGDTVKNSVLVRRNGDYRAMVDLMAKLCKAPLVQCEDRGLNFANGYVREDLSIEEHHPKYGATFTLPFDYVPESASRCNKWLEFLASTWGKEVDFDQRVMALQEMFAATLFGIAPAYQRAFLLFGKAATGKTQVLRVLRAMLPPDAAAELGPQYWALQFHLPALIGKTANICGELPESGMITGSMFKEVVEGAPVTDSFKGKDRFTFTPKCAHWFASNYLPASRDSSQGFTRRWLILDFNHPVAEKDQVKNLAETIVAEERGAIAAWALEGLRRLIDQNSYTIPACHVTRSGQMRRINNSVQAFLEDNPGFVIGEGHSKCRAVFDAYIFHMRDVGRAVPVGFEQFMQMLGDLNLTVGRDLVGDYVVTGLVKYERKAA